MRAIPKYLLIHRAELYDVMGNGVFGEKLYSEAVQLENVRVDYTSGINRDGIKGFNDKGAGQAVLIYDCRNSSPVGLEFNIGQKVIFGKRTFTVSGAAIYWGKNAPHHIEVTMDEVGL